MRWIWPYSGRRLDLYIFFVKVDNLIKTLLIYYCDKINYSSKVMRCTYTYMCVCIFLLHWEKITFWYFQIFWFCCCEFLFLKTMTRLKEIHFYIIFYFVCFVGSDLKKVPLPLKVVLGGCKLYLLIITEKLAPNHAVRVEAYLVFTSWDIGAAKETIPTAHRFSGKSLKYTVSVNERVV